MLAPPIPFGRTADGTPASLFTLENASGLRVEITDFGATLVRLFAPDRERHFDDVVLGFDQVADYERHPFFIGATIGRFANRIAGGRFLLDGMVHQLSLNEGPPDARRHLHGGFAGFHGRIWDAEAQEGDSRAALRLHRRSADGEEGYPGNLDVSVTYSVPAAGNELRIDYTATADRATPVNLTNHAYFNLGAVPDVLGHRMQIHAGHFTAVDASLIPRGDFAPVDETAFDFRGSRAIGERIGAPDPQLLVAGGYDHNYVLDAGGGTLSVAAAVTEPASGRIMEVLTTEPGLQFYSGNFLDGSWRGKGGRRYGRHAGFCLEAQHFPDSPNRPSFPSTILRPDQIYRSTTVYRFSSLRQEL